MMKFEEKSQILDEMLGKNREKSFVRVFVHNPNSPFFIDMTIGLPTAQEVADEIHKCGGSDFHRDGKQRLGYGVNGNIEITQDYLKI